MGKTLKVFQYRGSNVYIRALGVRWYEVLVVMKGRIFAHQVHIEKNGRMDKRLSTAEVEAGGVDQCLRAGIQLVDNLKLELQLRKVVPKYIKTKLINLYGKCKDEFRQRVGQPASVSQEQ